MPRRYEPRSDVQRINSQETRPIPLPSCPYQNNEAGFNLSLTCVAPSERVLTNAPPPHTSPFPAEPPAAATLCRVVSAALTMLERLSPADREASRWKLDTVWRDPWCEPLSPDSKEALPLFSPDEEAQPLLLFSLPVAATAPARPSSRVKTGALPPRSGLGEDEEERDVRWRLCRSRSGVEQTAASLPLQPLLVLLMSMPSDEPRAATSSPAALSLVPLSFETKEDAPVWFSNEPSGSGSLWRKKDENGSASGHKAECKKTKI